MKIKRFEGRTFPEVMKFVKKELGNDAVIISTESVDGKFYVTAAKDYELEPKENFYRKKVSSPKYSSGIKSRSQGERAYADRLQEVIGNHQDPIVRKEGPVPLHDLNNSIEMDTLKNEIKKQKEERRTQETYFLKELALLRESLSSLLRQTVAKDSDYPLHYTPYIKAGIETGIEEDVIVSILRDNSNRISEVFTEENEAIDILKILFSEKVKSYDLFSTIDKNGGVYSFVGPTGVGKTTTLVKIATNLIISRERDDVALISLDFMRADGSEQLKRYSNILGVPFYQFTSADEYLNSIENLRRKHPILLMDTAGVSPLSRSSLEFLENVCKNEYTLPILHIPVATEHEQAISIIDSYSKYIGEMMLVYTKEDEALRNGLLASLSVARNMTACFVTNGQHIPEDIIRLKTSSALVEILFKKKYDLI